MRYARVCLLVVGLLFLLAFTRSYIYAGMLVGYLEAKIRILSLLDLLFRSNKAEISYLSLRYDFPLMSTYHDGLMIIGINIIYWITLAILIYSLLCDRMRLSSWKMVFTSLLLAGIGVYLVGTAVLYLNFKNILSDSICCLLW